MMIGQSIETEQNPIDELSSLLNRLSLTPNPNQNNFMEDFYE
ncbi:MAG: hypothetical protein WCR42_01495 [bacterium]